MLCKSVSGHQPEVFLLVDPPKTLVEREGLAQSRGVEVRPCFHTVKT